MKPTTRWRLFSRIEAAEFIGMSPEFVKSLIEKGILPFFQLGRSIRISEEDLVSYLENARRQRPGGAS